MGVEGLLAVVIGSEGDGGRAVEIGGVAVGSSGDGLAGLVRSKLRS